jgi:hypothetical protein
MPPRNRRPAPSPGCGHERRQAPKAALARGPPLVPSSDGRGPVTLPPIETRRLAPTPTGSPSAKRHDTSGSPPRRPLSAEESRDARNTGYTQIIHALSTTSCVCRNRDAAWQARRPGRATFHITPLLAVRQLGRAPVRRSACAPSPHSGALGAHFVRSPQAGMNFSELCSMLLASARLPGPNERLTERPWTTCGRRSRQLSPIGL